MPRHPNQVTVGARFGARLEGAIDAAGLSVRTLARKAGVPQSSLATWRAKPVRTVGADHLAAVARVLAVDPNWLGDL